MRFSSAILSSFPEKMSCLLSDLVYSKRRIHDPVSGNVAALLPF